MKSSDRQLAHKAIKGDAESKAEIVRMADHLAQRRTKQLCRRFCTNYDHEYTCPLDSRWGTNDKRAPLCERGNASYEWMLNYLTAENRLRNFAAKEGEKIVHYFTTIVYSIPFIEKWKDQRFGRRIRVPLYVQNLDRHAAKIFYALYDGDDVINIAQTLNRTPEEIATVKKQIERELIKRHKLHTLFPTPVTSIHGDDGVDPVQNHDTAHPDRQVEHHQLHQLIKQLSVVERFIIQAMDIDNLDAATVLKVLKKEKLNRFGGKKISKIDQVYYIRNKVRWKLKTGFEAGPPNLATYHEPTQTIDRHKGKHYV